MSLLSARQHKSNKSTACSRIEPEPWGPVPLTAPGCSHAVDSGYSQVWEWYAFIGISTQSRITLGTLKSAFFGFCFCDLGTGDEKENPNANTVCGAHWRYYWPLFWEGHPPRTNQLFLFRSKWKSPFKLFPLQCGRSALTGPRAEGGRTAWLGRGSDRRSGSVVGRWRNTDAIRTRLESSDSPPWLWSTEWQYGHSSLHQPSHRKTSSS